MEMLRESVRPFPTRRSTVCRTMTGLDIDLMEAIAGKLGATVEFVPYDGSDFNGIFDGLGRHYDCVTAGTTVTPEREQQGPVRSALPHLRAVARRRHHAAAARQLHRRPRRPDHRRPAGQHQPADRRPAGRRGQGRRRPRLRLRRHPLGADRPDHRRMRRIHEARARADRARQADTRRRGRSARHLGREHRDRRRAR